MSGVRAPHRPLFLNLRRILNLDTCRRSPLVGEFRDKATGAELLVVLNHLACGDARLRQEQAQALRLCVEGQTLPVIGIGDYNFDFDFRTQHGNAAFDEFLVDGHWAWVRPDLLVDTNWADRDGDGKDNYPDSCLDFMFLGGKALGLQAASRVVVRDGDSPDDDSTCDYRSAGLVEQSLSARAIAVYSKACA